MPTTPTRRTLGDIASEMVGFDPDDVVGMLEVTVNGQSAQELGAVYVPGSNPFEFDVELPAAAPGRRDLVVEAHRLLRRPDDYDGTVYDDPPTADRLRDDHACSTRRRTCIRGEHDHRERARVFTPDVAWPIPR